MNDGLRIATCGCGEFAETLRVTLLAENGANLVTSFDGLDAPFPEVGGHPPDLLVIGVPDAPESLDALLRPLIETPDIPAPPIALLTPHPYPFAAKMAASLHRVIGFLRTPPDANDASLLLKTVRALSRAGVPQAVGGAEPADPAAVRKFHHDANNFLGQVMTGVSLLEDDSYTDEVRGVASRALDSCEHLRRCIVRFATLAGPLSPVAPLDPARAARETLHRVAEACPSAAFRFEGLPSVPDLPLREGDFAALLDELLRNAAEAGGEEAELRISQSPPGEPASLKVSVLDRGAGFDPARATREPFFTTKNRTYHKGFGLYLARLLARRLGAELRHLPREGGGTEARVTFPPREG